MKRIIFNGIIIVSLFAGGIQNIIASDESNNNFSEYLHTIYFEIGYQTSSLKANQIDSNQTNNPSLFDKKGLGFYRLSTEFCLMEFPRDNHYLGITKEVDPAKALHFGTWGGALLSVQGENLNVSAANTNQVDIAFIQAFYGSLWTDFRFYFDNSDKNKLAFYIPLHLDLLGGITSSDLKHKLSMGVGLVDMTHPLWKGSKFEFGYRYGNYLTDSVTDFLYFHSIINFSSLNLFAQPFIDIDLAVSSNRNAASFESYIQSLGNTYDLSLFIGIKKNASFIGKIINDVFIKEGQPVQETKKDSDKEDKKTK